MDSGALAATIPLRLATMPPIFFIVVGIASSRLEVSHEYAYQAQLTGTPRRSMASIGPWVRAANEVGWVQLARGDDAEVRAHRQPLA